MYTFRTLGGLGEIRYSRPMTLQKAVTAILTAAPDVQPFPGEIAVITAARFDTLVNQIISKANQSGYVPAFNAEEASRDLQYRGYRREAFTQAPVVDTTLIPVAPITQPVVVPITQPITTLQPVYHALPPPPLTREEPKPLYEPHTFSVPRPVPAIPPPAKPSNGWLWIAGLLALYLITKKGSNPHSARKRKGTGLSGLGGDSANCVEWIEVDGPRGGPIWRCVGYAPACKGSKCTSPLRLPLPQKLQLRTCVKTKKVKTKSWRFKRKTVTRCAKFQRVCPSGKPGECIDLPVPKPAPSPGHGMNINEIIKGVAEGMAEERNEIEEEFGKELGREIVSSGGLKPYKGWNWEDELSVVPLFMRRRDGFTPDAIAQELGFKDDTALLKAIEKEYPKGKKKQRVYDWRDFTNEAGNLVWSSLESGMVSGLDGLAGEGDLFPVLRRELVLETEDTATSDDPLYIFLQRKGWKIPRVQELQATIAEKAVPDMFTGKTTPLTGGEKELQRNIEEFMQRQRAIRTRPITYRQVPGEAQMALFGPMM